MNVAKIRRLSRNPIYGGIFRWLIAHAMKKEASSIAGHFKTYFKAEIAVTKNTRDAVQNIRHKVYCEELKFEPPNVDEKESDEFDEYSEYCVLRHIGRDTLVGCVRMVAPSEPSALLPIEKYCSASITNKQYHPSNFAREDVGEISRLAVLPEFRRRKVDKVDGAAQGRIYEATYTEEEFRCFPFISVGLYFAVAALTVIAKRRHIYVMTEPKIARSMGLVGIRFIQLGEPVDYHGLRAPYYINKDILFKYMSKGLKKLYLHIERDIAKSLKK
ncbi:PEP-CTERM/exosortase system-associated acyltransferase [Alteromonas sp. Cnat3-28]|uniref:PEP-CTERM/exosortase system-associated acyltransferase n=1 Tax=Alteromonas sp. Cnat3-28 TaxID=2917729 RepID=UPI001EF63CAB|nr:PEP-CTERM/exosortase system-associated acyltransferase [Alteromonas sp. Cnat3-28]MCG7644883.1 PEP-CTERM/exosortase system-associated acyltransferase [Alteromonas sp. Cnat3-28]